MAIHFVYTHEEQSTCLKPQAKKNAPAPFWGITIGLGALVVLLGASYALIA